MDWYWIVLLEAAVLLAVLWAVTYGPWNWLRRELRKRPRLPLHHLTEHYLSRDGTKVLVECPHCGIGSSGATETTGATPSGNGGSPRS